MNKNAAIFVFSFAVSINVFIGLSNWTVQVPRPPSEQTVSTNISRNNNRAPSSIAQNNRPGAESINASISSGR